MAQQSTKSIRIGAQPSAIMDVIADFPAYPEWAGAVKRCEVVEDGPGGRARQVRFVIDAGVFKDDYVNAYEWDGERRVSWSLVKGKALKSQEGSYTLDPQGQETEVTYSLAVSVNVPMIGMLRRKAEQTIMDTALKDLKKRAES